ncbi:unnamed protein product [Oppiella nova]|uniref:Uncharacterized protein n=1 Tax=Oppiella nova TaxID=334625 RepID=A0A7R9QF72_9ACAR|nr:unnamed protein product [Oppiella nova]CAG2164708.1 unnamed protein product [Oppiella nova]
MVKVLIAVLLICAIYIQFADAQEPACVCGLELGRLCGNRHDVDVPKSEPYLTGDGCTSNSLYECRFKHGDAIFIAKCPKGACQHNIAGEDTCLVA